MPSDIVLPEWQPDASVRACPLCANLFTWLNRRHHCRKCGRVVCATCSPHRITIPSAFVVRPPNHPAPAPVPVIDLTSSPERAAGNTRVINLTQGGRSLPPPHGPISPSSRRNLVHGSLGHHQHQPQPQQPQLAETDYCPICHRPLPYLSDPSEAGREAHITSCIVAATSTSASPSPGPTRIAVGGRQRSYTNGGRMVVWKASAKDCIDPATSEAIECVICFEDFEELQDIARLECLCRYHKRCIRDWFDRKGNGECPVHAVHE
ncbi:hypothetical protein EDC01DRAFT_620786 [Geopyxis carbonaria]|nr:hypothetical protein EDC01DRAFT_620786 [Geopyxis carbonaria]